MRLFRANAAVQPNQAMGETGLRHGRAHRAEPVNGLPDQPRPAGAADGALSRRVMNMAELLQIEEPTRVRPPAP